MPSYITNKANSITWSPKYKIHLWLASQLSVTYVLALIGNLSKINTENKPTNEKYSEK